QHIKDTMVILPTVLPGEEAPDWIERSATVAELAGRIGVPADALVETVDRWNAGTDAGADADYGRGTVWFENFMAGGPDPARLLQPLRTPPFYAMQLHNGTLGTCGGPQIVRDGRARSWAGGVIPGLYAAGNASA